MSLLQNPSAGVYFEEVNLSQVVTPVSTAIGGIVGEFLRGEPNKPILITSTKNLVDELGAPDPEFLTWPSFYCAFSFLRRSSQLYVVRALNSDNSHSYAGAVLSSVEGNNSSFSKALKKVETTVSIDAPNTLDLNLQDNELPIEQNSLTAVGSVFGVLSVINSPAAPNLGQVAVDYNTGILTFNAAQAGEDVELFFRPASLAIPVPSKVEMTENDLFFAHSIGPGTYGNNIRLQINSDNAISPTPVLLQTAGNGFLSASDYKIGVAAVTALGEMVPVFENIIVAAANSTVQVTFPKVSNAISYSIYQGTNAPAVEPEFIASIIQPKGNGAISFTIDGSLVPDGAYQTESPTTNVFQLNIFDTEISENVAVESFEVSQVFMVDGFNQQLEIESKINQFSRKIRIVKNPTYTTQIVYPTAPFTLVDGIDGNAPTTSDISLAWSLFENREQITVRHLINGGVIDPATQRAIIGVAERRGDATAYLDLPTISQAAQDAVSYRNQTLNVNTTFACLCTPDYEIQDDFNGRKIFIPPSGHNAGIGAASGVRAPAGLNRGILNDVLSLRVKYDQEDRDLLAAAKINYARDFPGRGIAIMEAFTLEGQTSALSFLNVRFTLNLIKPTLENALDFSLFEPNDDFSRRQILNLISEFLDIIRDDRAIQDYLVVIDESNNPPIVTGNGQLNVDIYLIPTLPIQRIRARLIVTKQGVSLAEVAASGV